MQSPPKTRIMLNGGVDYGDIRSEQLGEHNFGWQASAFLGVQQTFPWKLNWSVFMGGLTKKRSLQGYSGGFNMFTSTLSKSFIQGQTQSQFDVFRTADRKDAYQAIQPWC